MRQGTLELVFELLVLLFQSGDIRLSCQLAFPPQECSSRCVPMRLQVCLSNVPRGADFSAGEVSS